MKSLAIILSLNLITIVSVFCLLPEIQELKNKVINRSEHICFDANAKQKVWTATSSWTWNMSSASMKNLYAQSPIITQDTARFIYDNKKKVSTLFPDNFSVSQKWPKCADIILKIPKIILDSKCKTSWAVAMASVLTDRLCIFTRGIQRAELSPVDIVQCCKNCTASELTNLCKEGGQALNGWEYWIKHGIVSGGFTEENLDSGCKPMTDQKDIEKKCHETCRFKDGSPAHNAKIYKDEKRKYRFGEEAYAIPNSASHIMNEIFQYGPVQTSFVLYEDFFYYRNGVYTQATGKRAGYLSVKIIGWGEENGVHYWLLVNQWGKAFGENGTVRFLRGSNHLEIEQNAISCTYRRLDPRLNPLSKPSEQSAGGEAVNPYKTLLPLAFCTHFLYNRKTYF